MKIINLTQHEATEDQVKDGLIEPEKGLKDQIKKLLTFSADDIKNNKIQINALLLARIANDLVEFEHALIGGLPALMGPLVEALRLFNIEPVFSHSDRVSEDQHQPDGSVKKVMVFKHQFFYLAPKTGGVYA